MGKRKMLKHTSIFILMISDDSFVGVYSSLLKAQDAIKDKKYKGHYFIQEVLINDQKILNTWITLGHDGGRKIYEQ